MTTLTPASIIANALAVSADEANALLQLRYADGKPLFAGVSEMYEILGDIYGSFGTAGTDSTWFNKLWLFLHNSSKATLDMTTLSARNRADLIERLPGYKGPRDAVNALIEQFSPTAGRKPSTEACPVCKAVGFVQDYEINLRKGDEGGVRFKFCSNCKNRI